MSASINNGWRAAWLAGLVGLAIGCGPHEQAPQPPGELGEGPACGALGQMADLSHALAGGTLRGAGDPRYALVYSDEVLGYLGALDQRLDTIDPGGQASLRRSLERFTAAVQTQREGIEAQLHALGRSHELALAAVHEAAICQGVDLRDLSKSVDEVAASRPGATPLPPATTHEERVRRERQREDNQELLGSEACRERVRLWRAARKVELSSEVRLRSVASHIRELGLDPGTGEVRDRLAAALDAHADDLRALDEVIDPDLTAASPLPREVASASFELAGDIDHSMARCLESSPPTDRVRSGGAAPRVATVVVRPRYSDRVEDLLGEPSSFGSGFVVQWRTRDGHDQTRIVTNAHVMRGATMAELRPSDDPSPSGASSSKDEPLVVAHLVRSLPYDDIAVLTLEDSDRARELFGGGLRLRHASVQEQEPIIAAGFPGVGGTPSYQISEGVVSNARFGDGGAEGLGVTGYIQHTAPIDPGNSGGPLLDRQGHVVGMNTLKISGRENVGLAIPVPRIQFAMLRADEALHFEVEHARAACNLVVGALGAEQLEVGALDRLGLSLHESLASNIGSTEAVRHRDRVYGRPVHEADLVRVRMYAALRSQLEQEQGVGSYTTCEEVSAVGGDPSGQRFEATFRTRGGEHRMVLAEEDGQLRVVEIRSGAPA